MILNLTIWFSLHAIHPEPGRYDWFIAIVGLGAWFAMGRFKVGVIPVLGVYAGLGVMWKLF